MRALLGFWVIAVVGLVPSCSPLADPEERNPASGDLARWIPELEGMTLIPGGEVEIEFVVDRPRAVALGEGADEDTKVERETYRLRPLFMDRFEVTNSDYSRFLEESGYEPRNPHALLHWVDGRPPAGEEDMPVVFVDFDDAAAFARHYGKRLPTTAEWEWATRGDSDRSYPWGKRFNRNRLNCLETGIGGPCLVGTFETGINPAGCYDLAGNVWEWTSIDRHGEMRTILKGGSFLTRAGEIGEQPFAEAKEGQRPNEVSVDVGFRCVRDVSREIFARFLDLLRSDDTSVRRRVLEHLMELDQSESVRALRYVQRKDSDTWLRVWAAERLLLMGRTEDIELGALIEILARDPDFERRLYAADCLGLILASMEDGDPSRAGPHVLAVLRRFLERGPRAGDGAGRIRQQDRFNFVRELADLLIELGEWRVYSLLGRLLLHEDDRELRIAAAERLGRVNERLEYDYRDAARALYRAMRDDPDPDVREAAETSLKALPAEDSQPILIEILRSRSTEVPLRQYAAYRLSDARTRSSIHALGATLRNVARVPAPIRQEAAYSLGAFYDEDPATLNPLERAAVEALRGGLDDPLASVRGIVIGSLLRTDRYEEAERFLLDVEIPAREAWGWRAFTDALRLAWFTASHVRPAAVGTVTTLGIGVGIEPGEESWPYAELADISMSLGRPPVVGAGYLILAYDFGFNLENRLGRLASDAATVLDAAAAPIARLPVRGSGQ